jgi:quinol monooxygenase YgiN
MIIIAGHLQLDPIDRDAYLADRVEVMRHARGVPGCQDFALTPDPLDPGRVLVYERWETDEQLMAFREGAAGTGHEPAPEPTPTAASVHRYRISGVEAA